jgi:hypothetical protein
MKLSSALQINQQNIRTREFEMAGQKLKVRVPLSSEMEAITKAVDATEWQKKYDEMAAGFKESGSFGETKIEITEDDVLVDGKSIKELAQQSAQMEERITQMIRLLVPSQEGFDMNTITYKDIEDEFPFAVQIEMMKKIIEVIAPGYEETRKN